MRSTLNVPRLRGAITGARNSRLARATMGAVGVAIATQAVQLISGIIAARLLGPSDRGYLALLTVIPSSICQIGSLGLSLSFSYHVARERPAAATLARRLQHVATRQVLLLTLVHVAVVTAVVADRPSYVIIAAAITLASVPLSFASEYSLAGLQGLGELQRVNVLRLLTPVAYAVGLFPLVFVGDASLVAVAAIMIATNALATMPAVRAGRRYVAGRRAPSETTERQLRRFAAGSFAGYFSPLEAFRLDQLMVGLLVSPRALGIYVAGAAVANVPRFFGSAVGLIVAPAIAAESNTDTQVRQLFKFTALTTCLTLAVALPLIALVGYLLPFLYGNEFRDAIGVARWLLIASIFLAVRRVIANAARGLGRPTISAPSELLATVIFVGGMLVFSRDVALSSIGALFALSNGVGLVLLGVRMTLFVRQHATPPGEAPKGR